MPPASTEIVQETKAQLVLRDPAAGIVGHVRTLPFAFVLDAAHDDALQADLELSARDAFDMAWNLRAEACFRHGAAPEDPTWSPVIESGVAVPPRESMAGSTYPVALPCAGSGGTARSGPDREHDVGGGAHRVALSDHRPVLHQSVHVQGQLFWSHLRAGLAVAPTFSGKADRRWDPRGPAAPARG